LPDETLEERLARIENRLEFGIMRVNENSRILKRPPEVQIPEEE
jgi:hypothetical protein